MNTSKVNVLIIEDEKSIHTYLSTELNANGYRATSATTGAEGLSLAASLCPDVVLLDLGLPDMSGLDVLQQLRTWCHVPIIIISVRDQDTDKVTALDMGADDYITKHHFSTAELMARIRAALRHSCSSVPDNIYKALDLEINFEKRVILIESKPTRLTQIEYQLLALLAQNAGHVLTYQSILTSIWGPYAKDNSNQILRVNMANIRHKIEKNPGKPQYVFTEVGVGYRMRENEYEPAKAPAGK